MNQISGVSGFSTVTQVVEAFVPQPDRQPTDKQLELRQTFQDFVAGTFFKQMLKSLRRTHDKPAYFHGGRAEQVFQSQLDQQVAEDLARDRGAAFSDSLFTVFTHNLGMRQVGSRRSEVRG